MPGAEPGGADPSPHRLSSVFSLLGVPRVDAILGAVGEGDVEAFGAFYDRTAPAVFGLLRAALGGDAPAERATEQVYLRVWHSAPLFDHTRDSALALLLWAVVAEHSRCIADRDERD